MGQYSKRLTFNRTLRGNKDGYCVICGTFGLLTEDHVPPKGCINISDMILQPLLDAAESNRGLIIQGGVRFRTICDKCNNYRLGRLYDPALREFINGAITSMKEASKQGALFPIMKMQLRPSLVARALVGHILAAHSVLEIDNKIESLGANDALRAYFLDPDALFPEKWKIYCWPYPSRNQVIARHTAIMDIGATNPGKKIFYGHIIKFLPLGFWLIHEQPENSHVQGKEITPVENSSEGDLISVAFNLRNIPNLYYPENPSKNSITLISNDQCSFSKPRT